MPPADIAFWSALAFITGIFISSMGWNAGIVLLILIGFGFLGLALLRRLNLWKHLFIFTAVVALGSFYFNLYFDIQAAQQHIILNKQVTFSGSIVDEPLIREKYQSLNLDLSPPFRGTIRVLASPRGSYNYGDVIQIQGSIEPPRSVADLPTTAFPKIKVTTTHQGFWLKEKLLDFKSAIFVEFQKNLSGDQAALLGGITLGGTSGMSDALRNTLIASGMSYIASSYGLKIIMIMFMLAFVGKQFLPRRATFFITLIVILLFVLMSGGAPSAIRAAVMGSLVLLARELGRIYSARNALALTAAGMLVTNPGLMQDIGFTMAFSSILGILYLMPALARALRLKDKPSVIMSIVLMAIAAQIAVLPVSIAAFNSFPMGSIPASILVAECIPLTMFLGALLAVAGMLTPYLVFIVVKFAAILLGYLIGVVTFFADFSFPVSTPFGSPFTAAVVCALMMIFFTYYFSPEGRSNKAAEMKTNKAWGAWLMAREGSEATVNGNAYMLNE